MAYDSYSGRPHGEPGYFDDSSDYSRSPPEPHSSSATDRSTSNARQQSFPLNGRMTSSPERAGLAGYETVSSELIAEITERVKREVVEHLNRTGTVDDPTKAPTAPPLQRPPSNKSSSTSSPPPTARKVYTPPSPTQSQTQAPKPTNFVPPMEPVRDSARSPPSSPLDKPSGVRFADRNPAIRPIPGRTFSTMELSTIDQKWGRLFDNDGNPTQRLGQFLRGLANHVIEDFEPKRSIVITPSKMAILYSSHPLDKEPNPLFSIFRAESNEQISRLFQDLGCQHHLVQDHSTSAPTIPALTPLGFAQWMTIQILAYPDEESKRLEKIVLAMPIDADGDLVDGRPERLPKQISRHLLPDREHRKSRKLLNNAVADFLDNLGSQSRRKTSITSPPLSRHSSTSQSRSHPVEIHQVRTSPTSSKSQPIERERSPYAGAPSASESSGNEEPVKIERDRQPYAAQPGSGKVYAESINTDASKLGRTNSTSRTREPEQVETREARHRRTRSNASQHSYKPLPRPGGRRASSPPLKKYSDSTPIGLDAPGSKHGPGSSSMTSSFSSQPQSSSFPPPPPPPPPIDIRDTRDRRRDDRPYRRGTDEEPRFTGEFNSPKDAEKWDRYQEAREAREAERTEKSHERGSVAIDPRDVRDPRETGRDLRGGAPYEDWYREKARGPGHDTYARNY